MVRTKRKTQARTDEPAIVPERQETSPADAPEETPWHPLFHFDPGEQGPEETDAQYAAVVRDLRRHAKTFGIYLGLGQSLASHLGLHKTCARGACRRKGACCGRRHQDDWSLPFGPVIPPCVPRNDENVYLEWFRGEIRDEVDRVCRAAEKERAAAMPPQASAKA